MSSSSSSCRDRLRRRRRRRGFVFEIHHRRRVRRRRLCRLLSARTFVCRTIILVDVDPTRRRRSARLPVGGARATRRSGPGWAGPKPPQMGPGPPAAQYAHILTCDMKGNPSVFDPLRTSGFWRRRLGVFRRVLGVVGIMIMS